MVQEADCKAKDEKQRDKVSSKNSPDSYAFNVKAAVEDEKLQGEINNEDKQKILDKCNKIINWFDKNQTIMKEEFEHQQKELVCNPSLSNCTRVQGHTRWNYQAIAGCRDIPEGMPEGFLGGRAPLSGCGLLGPIIEEAD
ncbi:Heat shock cognate 71 kDa protein [Plecturocebus cupreus]